MLCRAVAAASTVPARADITVWPKPLWPLLQMALGTNTLLIISVSCCCLCRILRPCDSHVCRSPPRHFSDHKWLIDPPPWDQSSAVSSAPSNACVNNHVTVVWTCSGHLFKAKSIPPWMEGGEAREGWRRTTFYHVFHGNKIIQTENIPASLYFSLSSDLEREKQGPWWKVKVFCIIHYRIIRNVVTNYEKNTC